MFPSTYATDALLNDVLFLLFDMQGPKFEELGDVEESPSESTDVMPGFPSPSANT